MGRVAVMMEMRGAEDPSVLRFIGERDNACREALGRNEPQLGVFVLPEELPPVTQNQRMDREIQHIEQVVLEQRFTKKTMTKDEQIASFLLLEPAHLSHHIPPNEGQLVPCPCFHSLGK